MSKYYSKKIIVCVSILVFIFNLGTSLTQLNTSGWTEPRDISSETGYWGWRPKIIADPWGGVNVFWAGWVSDSPPIKEEANTIFYRYWDGTTFSNPVDILVANNDLDIDDIDYTLQGELVVLWHSGITLYISSAKMENANDPNAWITQQLLNENALFKPALVIDRRSGNWYVSYSNTQSIYVYSYDGKTWNGPILISSTHADYLSTGKSCVDTESGVLHIVWSEQYLGRNAQGNTIEHAKYHNEDQSIEQNRVYIANGIDAPTIDWPTIVCMGNKSLMTFWNNGVGSSAGRFYAISENEGNNWRVDNVSSGKLSGQTGFAGIEADCLGRIHIITSSQGPDLLTGMRYLNWKPDIGWSEYESLWPEISGEAPDLTIAHGNQLHVVWHEYSGKIYYMSKIIDAPYYEDLERKNAPPIIENTPEPLLISPTPIITKGESQWEDNAISNQLQGWPIITGVFFVVIYLGISIFIKKQNK